MHTVDQQLVAPRALLMVVIKNKASNRSQYIACLYALQHAIIDYYLAVFNVLMHFLAYGYRNPCGNLKFAVRRSLATPTKRRYRL